MIDIHCHILPGLDDGPNNMYECREMVNFAVKSGIKHLFATPHHRNGQYENVKNKIMNQVAELNELLLKDRIPLTIHPGQELRIHREIFASLAMDEILTLDNSGKYLLLELPSGEVPSYTREVVYELLVRGIVPIIAHPERNREIIRNHDLLFELVEDGAVTQITAGSIIGQFGKKIKSFSEKIIEHKMAHFIASDAHNVGSRGFVLREAYDVITKKFGVQRTFYFQENAELLAANQSLSREKPIPIRKKILGIF
ncbi:tyrosine protein phosphatase [Bacillus sp. BRMEA1]|uniref:tyrosine-protein phosphatase n=1 Tax=Neobacillus endophyticus TaxID=2738405 RepID=UPI0015652D55|nr:CpsB/CapC family capsule biosynthesis tyrosine phosphatase [Neobacillus endophyticus]NRD76338.1 tyrosine protein phosphatase [Neobacillus endophyticus]